MYIYIHTNLYMYISYILFLLTSAYNLTFLLRNSRTDCRHFRHAGGLWSNEQHGLCEIALDGRVWDLFCDFLIFTLICMATCDVTAERCNDVMTSSVIRWRHYVCRRQTVTDERRNATPRKQRLQCKTLFCTCWLPQKVNLIQKM